MLVSTVAADVKRRSRRCTGRLVSVAALMLVSRNATAAISATWASPIDGRWTDATRWTPGVIPNNSGDSSYDVRLGPFEETYAVDIGVTTITLDALSIAPGATLRSLDSRGTLKVLEGVTLEGGTLRFNQGRLLETRISGHGVFYANGTLESMTVAMDSSFGGVQLLNGLTLEDVTVRARYINALGTQSSAAPAGCSSIPPRVRSSSPTAAR